MPLRAALDTLKVEHASTFATLERRAKRPADDSCLALNATHEKLDTRMRGT